MKTCIKLSIYFFISLIIHSTSAQRIEIKSPTAEQWREDLKYMEKEMLQSHKNLFHTVTKEKFDSAVNALYNKIPTLQRHQIIVEMAKIVAMVGDGHSNIYPTRDAKVGFRRYPIQLYFFSDGLFIRSAPSAFKDWVGCKVIKFGNTDVNTAYNLIQTMIGRDNYQGAKFWSPFLMVIPEVLSSFNIIPDMEKLELLVEKKNKQFKIEMSPQGFVDIMKGEMDLSWQPKEGWVDMRDNSKADVPLWLITKPGVKYLYYYLPKYSLVYMQLNEIGNMAAPNDSIEQFCTKLFRFIDSAKVHNFVLDLRLNSGGNGYYNRPVIVNMIKSRTDVKGHSFVITGRRTFSAAQMLINRLSQYSNTLFVGEPSSSKLNAYGDSKKITLPNSEITVRVSSLYHQYGDERETESFIPIDISIELSSEDYKNNVDPCLNAILKFIHLN